jgi:magnesium-transporting ATPase (P-type)
MLSCTGPQAVHEVLNVLEFSSERARMSIVARAPDGTIRLHCKGSDAALLPRLRSGTDPRLLAATHDALTAYSVEARTLHASGL